MKTSHIVENDTVYEIAEYETYTNKMLVGPLSYTSVGVRIDDNTVADVTYQFDLTLGDYVEQSRVERPVDLSIIKQNKIDELVALKNADIEAGFTSNAAGTPIKFGYDAGDQEYLHKKATMIALNQAISSVQWKTADSGMVTFTRDQFIQVINDGAAHEEGFEYKYLNLEANVMNAMTATDVAAITW